MRGFIYIRTVFSGVFTWILKLRYFGGMDDWGSFCSIVRRITCNRCGESCEKIERTFRVAQSRGPLDSLKAKAETM